MPPCDGVLIRAHLIPRQLLKREGFELYAESPATWVMACGGPMGNAGHHGMLDTGHRPLRLPRAAIPAAVLEMAHELDALLGDRHPFAAYLDREFGTT